MSGDSSSEWTEATRNLTERPTTDEASTDLDAAGRERIREEILAGYLSPAEAVDLVPEWAPLILVAGIDDPHARIAQRDTADVDDDLSAAFPDFDQACSQDASYVAAQLGDVDET